MAKLYRTDGTVSEVRPLNGRAFTLAELQGFVGGLIEVITFPDGSEACLNDEGRINGMPLNVEASRVWCQHFPLDRYPDNNPGTVYGDVVVGSAREMGAEENGNDD